MGPLFAAALCLLLGSCATRARPEPHAADGSDAASGTAAETDTGSAGAEASWPRPGILSPAPDSPRGGRAQAAQDPDPAPAFAAAARVRPSFEESAAAHFRAEEEGIARRVLANGAELVVVRRAGKTSAAARIALAGGAALVPEGMEGIEALALALASKGPAGAPSGLLASALSESSATLSLVSEDYDDVALELLCPAERLIPLLELVGRCLQRPAFRQGDFEAVLREFRVAERREAADPLVRAAAILRARLYAGHPYAKPPKGSAASLFALGLGDLMAFWNRSVGGERLRVSVVGDSDLASVAAAIEPSLGRIPRLSASIPPILPLPLRPLFIAEPFPAAAGSVYLRGEYSAPPAGDPDFPAMTLALSMLDDLVAEELRGEGLAYGSWTRLSGARAASACVVVHKTADPARAKALVDRAIGDIASGLCLDAAAADGALAPLARALAAYKEKAVSALYGRTATAEALAARISRDAAAGGDGAGLFAMARRIFAVSAPDVRRVASERLLEGPSAWIALGDPALVGALRAQDFAR